MSDRQSTLERERRWLLPAGIASVAGVALILATFGESAAAIRSSEGLAEALREVHADSGPLLIASLVQALGWILLAVPLVVLFRAASARSTRMRTGLIGVVIVGPLFLAVGSVLGALAVTEAADAFTQDGPAAIERCVERKSEANQDAGQENRQGEAKQGQANQGQGGAANDGPAADRDAVADCEEQVARDERTSTSVAGVETGFGLAGLLGFTIAVVYTALWTLRTGLLTRFWGSLGIALGAVFSFFTLFTLAWFIYVGLLLAGWVPGGRPPAWASGEARPWPKGGPLFGGGGNARPDELARQITSRIGLMMKVMVFAELRGQEMENDWRSDAVQDGWKYRNALLRSDDGKPASKGVIGDAEVWLKFQDGIWTPKEGEPFIEAVVNVLSDPSEEEMSSWVESGAVPQRWANTLETGVVEELPEPADHGQAGEPPRKRKKRDS